MSHDVFLTRREFWSDEEDEGTAIPLDERLRYVEADPDLVVTSPAGM